MEYYLHSHRFGCAIAYEPEFLQEWSEIEEVLSGITDNEIISTHKTRSPNRKSISTALNFLIHDKLEEMNWKAEPPIFQDIEYNSKREKRWRLDFAKNLVSIEVAFNHGEATAWNLLKPVLASELNHVRKAIQTELGVIIMASEELKEAGGFDEAVGTYEKAIRYLDPLQSQLSCPLILIGLRAPESFRVAHVDKPKRAKFILM